MRTLSQDAQQSARTFIITHARPLEQARHAYHFQDGPRSAVFAALAIFQNADGGFGNALEPDLRLSDSSALATTTALQILRELGAAPDHPLVAGAMRYLVSIYDVEHHIWPIIPANADDAPHAPWWNYNPDPAAHRENPTPEIAGYCVAYADHVPDELRQSLLTAVMDHFMTLADHVEMHSLLCYIRLHATEELPAALRSQLQTRLNMIIESSINPDPAEWSGYVLQPLQVVHTPDSPFATNLAEPLAQNLDFVIENQDASGAWVPRWSWGELHPDVWPVAEREWRGVLTLETLLMLRNFGRFA